MALSTRRLTLTDGIGKIDELRLTVLAWLDGRSLLALEAVSVTFRADDTQELWAALCRATWEVARVFESWCQKRLYKCLASCRSLVDVWDVEAPSSIPDDRFKIVATVDGKHVGVVSLGQYEPNCMRCWESNEGRGIDASRFNFDVPSLRMPL